MEGNTKLTAAGFIPHFAQVWQLVLFVLLPLIVGVFIYSFEDLPLFQGFIRNYIPDFLWAFSWGSCMLWLWKGRIPTGWWVVMVAGFTSFELAQMLGFIQGHGDYWDIIIYGIGLFLAKKAWKIDQNH